MYRVLFIMLSITFLPMELYANAQHYVPKEVVEKTLKQAILARGIEPKEDQNGEIQVSITGNNIGFPIQPEQSSTPEVKALEFTGKGGHFSAAIIFPGNKPLPAITVNGKFSEVIEIPVLTRQIKTGEIIKEHNITSEKMDVNRLRSDTIRDKSLLIGMQPKRFIGEGRAIAQNDLMQPYMVSKGETVKMFYKSEYLDLQTIGKALEDGTKGAAIRVENIESGKVIIATVTGHQQVQVGMPAGKTGMEVASHD